MGSMQEYPPDFFQKFSRYVPLVSHKIRKSLQNLSKVLSGIFLSGFRDGFSIVHPGMFAKLLSQNFTIFFLKLLLRGCRVSLGISQKIPPRITNRNFFDMSQLFSGYFAIFSTVLFSGDSRKISPAFLSIFIKKFITRFYLRRYSKARQKCRMQLLGKHQKNVWQGFQEKGNPGKITNINVRREHCKRSRKQLYEEWPVNL